MGEHHRPQQTEAPGETDGGLERRRLENPDREEDDPERLGRSAVPAGEQVRDERLRDEAAAEAVQGEERRQSPDVAPRAIQRRPSCSAGFGVMVDAGREVGAREQAGARGQRIGEEPAGRRARDRNQGAGGPGEGRDRVVRPEEAGRVGAGVRKHRLLEGRERAGLDDLGRERAGQPDEHERGQPVGEGEDRSGDRHRGEQQPVAAPPADAVAVPPEQDRDERRPGQHRDQNDAGLCAREAATGQRRPDHHGAQAVDDRACRLDGDDPPRVRTEAPHG